MLVNRREMWQVLVNRIVAAGKVQRSQRLPAVKSRKPCQAVRVARYG
jgi:hypothetical protein